MADTVDLQVVGKNGDISRSEMAEKLVAKFKQDASAFESLLDAAFGESGPYSAQSDVNFAMAEEGRQQLESLGLVCSIVSTGTDKVIGAATDTPEAGPAELDSPASSGADDFDINEIGLANDSAAPDTDASVKKVESTLEDDADLQFTDELDSIDSVEDTSSVHKQESTLDKETDSSFTSELGSIEDSENNSSVKKVESELDLDADGFNDELDSLEPVDGGGASGISAAKSREKPDASADVEFSDDLGVDSSDEVAPMLSQTAARKSKLDVPDNLSAASFDDLEADLIDPAPAEKAEKKAPVEMDDGGLSLSDDDSAPLTTPKSSADSESKIQDDGGLSLTDGDIQPAKEGNEATAQAPVTETPDAGEDGAMADFSADLDELESPPKTAEVTAEVAADSESDQSESSPDQAAVDLLDSGNDAPEAQKDLQETTDTLDLASDEETGDSLGDLLGDLTSKTAGSVDSPVQSGESQADASQAVDASPAGEDSDNSVADTAAEESLELPEQPLPEAAAEQTELSSPETTEAPSQAGGLVLGGQINPSLVPDITPEEDLEEVSSAAPSIDEIESSASVHVEGHDSSEYDEPQAKAPAKRGRAKILVAAAAGIAVLAGAGTFAFMNAGSLSISSSDDDNVAEMSAMPVKDAEAAVNQVKVETGDLSYTGSLEQLSTEELLVNLSVQSNADSIVELEPYFLESVNRARSGPRFGAAVPADSDSMVGRVPHAADKYFDDWSNREADLSLFLALLDSLIMKGELEVAQQLSDRAKDKLFAVMSSQRLARAYSDAGENQKVAQLMARAARDTFAIKAAEERVLAISDYGLTEQALGLNEDAMDTFLTTSILARSLAKPELKTVGLSSAARYFQRSGRDKDAQKLLEESMQAGMMLPENTAARDLAIRFVALTEARMGLFNQALEHTRKIVDPVAAVSAYHGIALAIESAGDETNARKILNMAYRTGSKINDKEERSKLLAKVVLASESK